MVGKPVPYTDAGRVGYADELMAKVEGMRARGASEVKGFFFGFFPFSSRLL